MKRKLAIGAVLVAVVAAAASTYAWASAGAATQTLNACVDRDGQLRLVAIAGDCKKPETALSWNTVGPAGPAGADGKQGAAGRDGLTGPQGPAGGTSGTNPPDPDSLAGTAAITSQKQGALSPITLTGFSHEIVSPRDPASGLPTGKRMHKPLTITKEIDRSTPLLLSALTTNENLTSVTLSLTQNGTQVATVKLTNANISNYVAHGLTETWSFTYQKITWTWVDGGITAEDDWEAPVAR